MLSLFARARSGHKEYPKIHGSGQSGSTRTEAVIIGTPCVAFYKYDGSNLTFAGKHDPEFLGVESNDPKELVLFDVNIHKRGFISPKDFVELFGLMPIAEVIYQGVFSPDFIDAVRNGEYPVKEGIIAKGGSGHGIWMRKVKTLEYLEQLKTRFPDIGKRWEDFWE